MLDRIAKLTATVSELRTILASEEGIKGVIRDELLAIKARFGDDRRTELVPMENEIVLGGSYRAPYLRYHDEPCGLHQASGIERLLRAAPRR